MDELSAPGLPHPDIIYESGRRIMGEAGEPKPRKLCIHLNRRRQKFAAEKDVPILGGQGLQV
jgi:hypothetical protein